MDLHHSAGYHLRHPGHGHIQRRGLAWDLHPLEFIRRTSTRLCHVAAYPFVGSFTNIAARYRSPKSWLGLGFLAGRAGIEPASHGLTVRPHTIVRFGHLQLCGCAPIKQGNYLKGTMNLRLLKPTNQHTAALTGMHASTRLQLGPFPRWDQRNCCPSTNQAASVWDLFRDLARRSFPFCQASSLPLAPCQFPRFEWQQAFAPLDSSGLFPHSFLLQFSPLLSRLFTVLTFPESPLHQADRPIDLRAFPSRLSSPSPFGIWPPLLQFFAAFYPASASSGAHGAITSSGLSPDCSCGSCTGFSCRLRGPQRIILTHHKRPSRSRALHHLYMGDPRRQLSDHHAGKPESLPPRLNLVDGERLELPRSKTPDLQSGPRYHYGTTHPNSL